MKARLFIIGVLFFSALFANFSGPARAQGLVADLSRHEVNITTGFVGTDVLLFGAVEVEGDVIVVVRGPNKRTVVRHKSRVGGIWINNSEVSFANAPTFYRVASTRPVEDLLKRADRTRHRIGLDNLRLRPERAGDPKRLASFRAGLIRNKVRSGVYGDKPGRVALLGPHLFRSTLYFPANVPTGTYLVEVYLVRNGSVISAQTTPLRVAKAGLGAEIYQFAHRNSALYGIIAILIALLAGWLAGVVFRKV
ncbi:MAG: TIGR02186 family protein [Alphaproteobacteria bacterium]|jgi:uncharacterized protein (TIGR02186 family)